MKIKSSKSRLINDDPCGCLSNGAVENWESYQITPNFNLYSTNRPHVFLQGTNVHLFSIHAYADREHAQYSSMYICPDLVTLQ